MFRSIPISRSNNICVWYTKFIGFVNTIRNDFRLLNDILCLYLWLPLRLMPLLTLSLSKFINHFECCNFDNLYFLPFFFIVFTHEKRKSRRTRAHQQTKMRKFSEFQFKNDRRAEKRHLRVSRIVQYPHSSDWCGQKSAFDTTFNVHKWVEHIYLGFFTI